MHLNKKLLSSLVVLLIIKLNNAMPTNNNQLFCVSTNQAPIFTNHSVCSSENIWTCCPSNNNNNNNNKTLNLEVFDLFTNVVGKFDALKTSFNSAIHLIDALHCPLMNESLMLSTETGLKKLSSVNWSQLLTSTMNEDCKNKLIKANHCANKYTCGPLDVEIKPCRGYCTNIIRGCFNTLSENIQTPWKHAVNSVRTALRLIHTQQGCIGLPSVSRDLEFLTSNMNTWREPLNWIDALCEFNPEEINCFNGDFNNGTPNINGGYKKLVSPWNQQSNNPEFRSNSELVFENDAILSKQKEELISITKSLERFWPQLSSHSPPNVDQQSDEADNDDYSNHDDEYDDENYSQEGGSGSGSNLPFVTDDEDLINSYYGNKDEIGSGSHSNTDDTITIIKTTPPPSSSSIKIQITITTFILTLIVI